MYYFYYRQCCLQKETAIAYKSLRQAKRELRENDGTPDSDIESYTTDKNKLPFYVNKIAGDISAYKEYDDKTNREIWHKKK